MIRYFYEKFRDLTVFAEKLEFGGSLRSDNRFYRGMII